MTSPFQQLDTVLLRVSDLGKAKRRYEEKLGLTAVFVDEEEKIVVFELSGASLTLHQLKPGETKADCSLASTYPIFYVKDLEEAHQYLQNRGVDVKPISQSGGVRFFNFCDLDGNQLEACSY